MNTCGNLEDCPLGGSVLNRWVVGAVNSTGSGFSWMHHGGCSTGNMVNLKILIEKTLIVFSNL